MPVAVSNGLTIAKNAVCSLPPHGPITVTVPPIFFPPAASRAACSGVRRPVDGKAWVGAVVAAVVGAVVAAVVGCVVGAVVAAVVGAVVAAGGVVV